MSLGGTGTEDKRHGYRDMLLSPRAFNLSIDIVQHLNTSNYSHNGDDYARVRMLSRDQRVPRHLNIS